MDKIKEQIIQILRDEGYVVLDPSQAQSVRDILFQGNKSLGKRAYKIAEQKWTGETPPLKEDVKKEDDKNALDDIPDEKEDEEEDEEEDDEDEESEEDSESPNVRSNKNGHATTIHEDDAKLKISERGQRVLTAMGRGKVWFTEISTAAGVPINSVAYTLGELQRKMLIEKVSNGKYVLTEKGQHYT